MGHRPAFLVFFEEEDKRSTNEVRGPDLALFLLVLSHGFWRKTKEKKTPRICTVMCFSHLIHSEGNDLLNSEDEKNTESAKKFYRIWISSTHLCSAQSRATSEIRGESKFYQ